MAEPSEPDLVKLPHRERDGHKGTYGRVLLVAGSRGMAGAAGLAGLAALRGGAGLVTVACPAEIVAIVASYNPSYLTLPLPGDDDGCLGGAAIAPILGHRADVIALGPGLGRGRSLARLVAQVAGGFAGPLILDADGLNHLAGHLEVLARPGPTILSPHVGEFSRLTGVASDQIPSRRRDLAREFAAKHGVVLILKGHGSVVTDGSRVAINPTGNPGMATGGTGDVLTGLLAAICAQGLPPFDAARLAAHVHGLAGDIVARAGSEISLIASDLVAALPAAWRMVEGEETGASQGARV